MSEKPQKRLVSKEHYTRLMAQRTTLATESLSSLSVGVMTLLVSVALVRTALRVTEQRGTDVLLLFIGLALGCLSAGMLFMALRFYKKERTVERVSRITVHNAHLLPPEESLVRASDVPPSQQQAELLRAAQYGKETPAEELLRATTTHEPDKGS